MDDDWLADRPDDPSPSPTAAAPSRRPLIANRPVSSSDSDQKDTPAPKLHAAKLLQRPKGGEDVSSASKAEAPKQKSLQQKEAEYAAARARIFGYGGGNGGGGGRGQPGRGRGRGFNGQGHTQHGRYGDRQNNGWQSQNSNVADRVKHRDADDPDYDRNPVRYAPRMTPANVEEPMPCNGSRYIPPSYEDQFPTLG
eukprot:TRINITY_DN109271_c0_g1_i1.p1 TRINITY_DN109271_c0_g1~~TRINITY_DN109271_c0_g1_i1.p1  ORF type:complete len:196 (+),score=35.80 TRINITY_DN109271_c0_g1_i1:96-683(+)